MYHCIRITFFFSYKWNCKTFGSSEIWYEHYTRILYIFYLTPINRITFGLCLHRVCVCQSFPIFPSLIFLSFVVPSLILSRQYFMYLKYQKIIKCFIFPKIKKNKNEETSGKKFFEIQKKEPSQKLTWQFFFLFHFYFCSYVCFSDFVHSTGKFSHARKSIHIKYVS